MAPVAIIGAGPSGLVAAKSLLERGLEPILFEASSQVGGMWGSQGRGAWSSCARTNLSFHSCAFSDFPWPKGTDVFPYRKEMADYLKRYAAEFGLSDFISFNRTVRAIRPEDGRKWRIDSHDASSAQHSSVYDNVIVATGFFSEPYVPAFPGLHEFRGDIFHSIDCDSPDIFHKRFHGKRVLVVGAAFSGTEIACLLTQFAKSTTVTFRSPMWFVPRWVRTTANGPHFPLDLILHNRSVDAPMKRKAYQFLKKIAPDPGSISPELAFDKTMEPPTTMVITDEFLHQLQAGLLSVKRSQNLTFDATGVRFSDMTRLDVDAVVICTGFTPSLPFFADDILRTIGFDAADQLQPTLLHRHLFHPDLPGLAFVGHYRGPYFPIMELQSRWIARIIAGERPLPSRDEMRDGIEAERRIRELSPRPQFPCGDFVELADGLAREIGVFPELAADHPLRGQIDRGPVLPAHFRLIGPDAKPDLAAELIRSAPAAIQKNGLSYEYIR